MTLAEIAENIRGSVASSSFTDSLKFDCGDDGVLVIANNQVSLEDQRTDCTLKLSVKNLAKLVSGNLNPMTAVMMGKLKVSGDPGVAMKLASLLKG
ncbi:Putative sterol carrier protein [Thalassovita gelatinovora]|uniref:Putative sterol carrier protein n=1 Tax=Thalassovita gelatinovora TaxID=53501 RepID=A0A0P1F9V7_THAGE|nr:SCP2 sterol-binding domain-containing protein [Thalassovita gelatinovora]QIZ81069.1 SCP2 sterol-binding domain-containing protein [Thalassovita gelatinovora]CUH64956.1 Putative sterol carrier protein [Thalassovita gelatinovora]SEP88893.1 Putative sterol carrier protein [Thalassovita gelatinovora]